MAPLSTTLLDPSRLAALRATALLDSPPEEAFDRVVRLASRVLRAPTALVSLVDDHRQFFKAAVGLAEPWAARRETPLSHSFCKHVVAEGAPLLVSDARRDPRVAENLAVSELGVAAYAGVPLVTAGAHTLGALCVVEARPREWSADEVELLRELASLVMTEVELRLATRAMSEQAALFRAAFDAAAVGVVIRGVEGEVLLANDAVRAMLGYGSREVSARPPEDYAHPDERAVDEALYADLLAGRRRSIDDERRVRSKDGAWVWVRRTASVVRDADDAPRFSVTMVSDLTAVKRSQDAVRLLYEVSKAANQAATSREALRACLDQVCAFTGWPVGHAYVTEGGELVSSGQWRLGEGERFAPFRDAYDGERFAPGTGLPGVAFATGQPAWIEDVQVDPAFTRARVARAVGLRSGFAFPVLVGREVVAVLEFFTPRPAAPDPAVAEVMSSVGTQLGRVVERERHDAEVRSLSVRDELTGLYNRRGFMALGEQRLTVAARQREGALLFFVDLNGMKPINDRLGHEEGDRALRDAAAILRRTFRESDIVARLGGDEFVVLTTGDTAPDATPMLTRLRAHVDAHNETAGRAYRVELSVGVSRYDPATPDGLPAMLAEADAAMYAQKRESGRGR
ncbi:MAG: diguanylate cyclase [Polyangiales bacterium]